MHLPTLVTAAPYAEELAGAGKTGLDESVITGVATIRGRSRNLLCDFAFLGGSIGWRRATG